MQKKVIRSDQSLLREGVDFIRDALAGKNVSKKNLVKTALIVENVLVSMIDSADNNETPITLEVSSFLGNTNVKISGAGRSFDISDIQDKMLFEERDVSDVEANTVIKRLVNNLYADSLSVKCDGGYNKARITVRKSPYFTLLFTIGALLLGIITGFFMKQFVPEDIQTFISKNIFSSVYDVFMSALKLIVGPLVFCSIAASIADFSDLKALGRIALKIVTLYLITSLIAIVVGYLTYQLFPIGDTSLSSAVDASAAADTLAKGDGFTVSIRDTLVNIVPSDFVTPFQKSDMLQIIFMAVVVGLGAAALSLKKPGLQKGLDTANLLVSRITSTIVAAIPLIVFCSMAKVMINMDLEDLMDVVKWIPVIYIADILMIIMYMVLLLLFARVNPFIFLKKYFPAMASAFSLASSNAALPTSVKMCGGLGIPRRIYSFSLPLGATINMDGSCITLMITSLFFARIYGIEVTGGVILSLALSIMLLSIGAPGVPGGNLICIALIIPQIGIPAETISLILGLYPIIGMMQTCVNVTGDAVVTTIVTRNEKLLDIEKFVSKKIN